MRPSIRGKFIFIGEEKFLVKGVSYGPFRSADPDTEYRDSAGIDRDFAHMAENGINTVRIPHTMPPASLLDIAQRHGLRVLAGLSAERFAGFLIDRDKRVPDLAAMVREKVRTVAGHPALLGYAIGNEIPSVTARWLGARAIERHLHGIFRVVKEADPEGLVTYANYPSTEYLELPFLDFLSFNVYLEDQKQLHGYVRRLHVLAGDRPLLLSEVGLDALRHGEARQAEVVDWQLRTIFQAGCAGAVVFAWTDEWHRGGVEVDDWAFGLTTRAREDKPALEAARRAFAEAPIPPRDFWPRMSVIICSYNGSATLRATLAGTCALSYPDFEVIVIDDGSTDATAAIAREFDCRLISTANQGLSAARNRGCQEATGEIVVFLDDDASPDPDWLHFLAHGFLTTTHAAIGGPNSLPPVPVGSEGYIDQAPGGAKAVLLTDDTAEHIPGCNFAIRRQFLLDLGGFDPVFRVAGDDVDLCWRVLEAGGTIGYLAGAVVWHHRRPTVAGYWKQQVGYGKAEALLERKWPDKYNSAGHHTFQGRIYGNGAAHALFRRRWVRYGAGGLAPFQPLHEPPPRPWALLPLMPEWHLLVAFLGGCSALGFRWRPMFGFLPLALAALAMLLAHVIVEAARARVPAGGSSSGCKLLIGWLHFLQPLARLKGRLAGRLTAWRVRGEDGFVFPRTHVSATWTEDRIEPESRLAAVHRALRTQGHAARAGGDFDPWDLEVLGGLLGGARLLMAVEDHGATRQHVRLRLWPRVRPAATLLLGVFGALTVLPALATQWDIATIFGLPFAATAAMTVVQSGRALAVIQRATSAQPAGH